MIEQAKQVAQRLRETNGDAFNKYWELHLRGDSTIDALVAEVERQKALHHDCAGQLRYAESEKESTHQLNTSKSWR